ncbi:stage II sporulation protein P [Hathewaya histolytica]|uniref:Stage II sporulation protein P n=1 Tax=Hathewaya histolytica TaxID=1498 RepID=A0A4U9RHQ8_HATHI|nr:stage II sporulation protein P [Hathewaya histolytica]VTQ90721.1 stage II sporulation protein P [Hathewaya histolytica]
MSNKGVKYNIRKGKNNRCVFNRNINISQKKKIYSFFILSIFVVSILIPNRINASTGKGKNDFLYTNLIKFTFPNIKIISKDKNVNLLGLLLGKKDSEDLIKNEVSYLKNYKQNKGALDSAEQHNSDEDDKDSEALFILDDKSVTKFKDNVQEKEIVTQDSKNFKNSPFKNEKRPEKPQVLIYHSHTHEGFIPGKPQENNNEYNIVAVGETLKNNLEQNFNVNVIHDKSVHDTTYTRSYQNSGATLSKYLKQYGDFDLIIDLHRDSLNSKEPVVCKVNGENAARFMFVVATENPKYATGNKKVVENLVNISNKNYPGLIRGKSIFAYRRGMGYYNQNKSSNSVLIEMGAQCNNISEVKNTAKYLSPIIAEYLKTKK